MFTDIILFLVIVYQGYLLHLNHNKHNEHIERIQQLFHQKIDKLLDRVQAPSFDHLKQAEVRVIKANKPDEPKEQIELL